MTLKELLDFNPGAKRDLFEYLKKNKIKYKFKDGSLCIPSFQLEDFGEVEIFYYIVFSGVVHSVGVRIDRSRYPLSDIKDKCYELFGTPGMDNTNHETEEPYICWQRKHLSTAEENDGRRFYVIGSAFDISNVKISRFKGAFDLPMFLISMLGGFVWGFLFFVLFGFGVGHSLELFVLSMIGGVVFGLLMFLALGLAHIFEAKPPKYKRAEFKARDVDLLDEYGRENYPDSISSLAKTDTHTYDRLISYTAKIFVTDDSFNVVYIKGKKLILNSTPYSSIKRFYGNSEYVVIWMTKKDGKYVHLSGIQENLQEIIDTVRDKLGYNSEKFAKMQSIIYDCIVKFDPASQIALGSEPSIFEESAKNMAESIFLKDNIDLQSIINGVADDLFDHYYDSFDELAHNIYERLLEEKVI
ncbi:MAG: hypothetical protein IJX97_05925 [Clostridia bacterium]|nr:hypothetical protein [Clostridia bacterium]